MKTMKRPKAIALTLVPGLGVVLALGGCATSEESLRKTLLKNPDLVFEVIEKNPEQFIAVVNRAAESAQRKQYENRAKDRQTQMDADLKNPKKPVLDSKRRISGNDAGKIVIVEYADFQCPACAMGHRSLKAVLEKYGKDVQFYFKHMPLDFHPLAEPLARQFEAIRRVSPEKAAQFHHLIFEGQARLKEKGFVDSVIKKLGLNPEKIAKDAKDPDIDRVIGDDQIEFQKFGFSGTPSLIINGVALEGAASVQQFEEVIQRTSK